MKYSAKQNYVLHKFLGKHSGRGHNNNVAKIVNAVNLKKLEIRKFNEHSTKWQSYSDSFQAADCKSANLIGVEKLHFLRCFLERNGLHAIAGFSLANDSYRIGVIRKQIWKHTTDNRRSYERSS